MSSARTAFAFGILAALVGANVASLPAQTGVARVEEVRSMIGDALRYRELASKAFVAGNFEAGCTHLQSSVNAYGAAVRLATQAANDISAPTEARAAMREIAVDARVDQGTMLKEHARRCTVELTPEERERQLAERVAKAEFLDDLISSLNRTETLWKKMNRGSGVKDPVAVRQFLTAAGHNPNFGPPARRLLAKLEAERARSPLKPVRRDPKELLAPDVLPAAGKTFRDCSECPAMVSIADGPKEVGYRGSTFRVTLDKRIAIGVTEVTRGEWRACVAADACSSTPLDDDALRPGEDDHPVSRVTYAEAERYADWITRQTRHEYAIPTELEWEAAGAGVEKETFLANTMNDGDDRKGPDIYLLTSPVRFFGADPNGTFDMIGNVAEWTDGCFNRQYDRTRTTGGRRGDGDCSKASVKGGAFVFLDGFPQIPGGAPMATGERHPAVGLRLIRRQSRDYAAAAAPAAAPIPTPSPAPSPTRTPTPAPAPASAPAQRREIPRHHGITMQAKSLSLGVLARTLGYELPYYRLDADGLNCSITLQAWAGGPDADGLWRPRARSPNADLVRNRTYAPAFDEKVIDGASAWTLGRADEVFHVRITPGRPVLSVQCDDVPADRMTEAVGIAESVRWPGEPTAGDLRWDSLDLPNHNPLTDAGMLQRVSRLTPEMLAFYQAPEDGPANYPTLRRVGLTALLPGLDWAIVPKPTDIMIRNLDVGVVCHAAEGKEWRLGDLAGPMSTDPNVALVGKPEQFTDASTAVKIVDGVAVRRGSNWEYEEVIMRYVPGRPTLVVRCDTASDADVDGVRELTKAVAASVRWGDEPPSVPPGGAASAPPTRP